MGVPIRFGDKGLGLACMVTLPCGSFQNEGPALFTPNYSTQGPVILEKPHMVALGSTRNRPLHFP